MDIIDVIYYLGDAIYYFHAKDTEMNMSNVRKNGVLDTKHYSDVANRSWVFRTMGYGTYNWKQILSALKVIGYDDSISIEHEDGLMSAMEGLDKAIEYKLGARGLRSIVETIMMDAMYEIPSEQCGSFVVTLEYAKQQLEKANVARLQSA